MAEKRKNFWGAVVRRDRTGRHSMYETGSQPNLDKSYSDSKARNDVPVTSHSASGSVDRLSTLGKKPPRTGIFNLKSKSSFWKPLLKHSTVASTAPLIATLMRDTQVQTEQPTRLTNDFGVQTVEERPAHTCDVLVQTCSAWDDQAGIPCDRFSTPTNAAKPLETNCLGNRTADYVCTQTGSENTVEVTTNGFHSPTPQSNEHDNKEISHDLVAKPDFLANVKCCSLKPNPDSPNQNNYERFQVISLPSEFNVTELSDTVENFKYPIIDEDRILEDFINTFSEPSSPVSRESKEKTVFSWPSDFSTTTNRPQNVKRYNVVSFTDPVSETSVDVNPLSRLKRDFDYLRNDFGSDSNRINNQSEHIDAVTEVPTIPALKSDFDALRQHFSEPIRSSIGCAYDLSLKEVNKPQEQEETLIMKDQPFPVANEILEKDTTLSAGGNRAIFSEKNEFEPMNEWDCKLSEDSVANRWSAMSIDSEKDRSDRCSSSNTSCRGSSASGMEALYADSYKFDSCENLDQLEDEIIRSLCSPIEEIYDNECGRNAEESTAVGTGTRNFEIYNQTQKIETCVIKPKFTGSQKITGRNEMSVHSNEDNTNTLKHADTTGAKIRGELIDKLIRCIDDKKDEEFVREQNEININRTIEEHIDSRTKCDINVTEATIERNITDWERNVPGQETKKDESKFKLFRQYGTQPEEASGDVNECVTAQSNVKNVRFEDDMDESFVEVFPCQAKVMPNVLEVRRSSWSTIGPRTPSPYKENPKPGPILENDGIDTCNTGANNVDPETGNDRRKSKEEINCLKPSQIQQSLFAGELSALHSKNRLSPEKVNEISILSEKHDSPSSTSTTSNATTVQLNYWPEENDYQPEVKVKSEMHITLKPLEVKPAIGPSEDMDNMDIRSNILYPPPPPPPPLPPSKTTVSKPLKVAVKDHQLNSVSTNPKQDAAIFQGTLVKNPMMQELERKFLSRQKIANDLEGITKKIVSSIQSDTKNVENVETQECEGVSRNSANSPPNSHVQNASPQYHENSLSFRPAFKASGPKAVWMPNRDEGKHGHRSNGEIPVTSPERHYQNQNWSTENRNPSERYYNHETEQRSSPSKNPCNGSYVYQQNGSNGEHKPTYAGKTVITDEAPPHGAVLINQKVTVDGDKIHTDKYYAVPVKEVLKEKTSTTKFIPAPPKYEGIGPTEEGIPTGLRQSVKKENMSDWYKTMYKTLHKVDNVEGDTYIVGYTSEPEIGREEKRNRAKSATLDSRQRSGYNYPPSAKSSIELYNVHPRPIEDFEPGYSSVTDNEINTGSKRFLPSLNHPKPAYEFKDGYESETSVVKKLFQPDGPNPDQQKVWYREIQRGGDIPQYGLGKLAPEKHNDPVIGPPPPPPLNYPKQAQYPQATRPLTLPPENLNHIEDNYGEYANGMYANQMRQAIHTELHQRMYPGSPLSPNNKTVKKPPAKSPEMKMVARILYDFAAETHRELSLKKDEVVLIHKQLDKNWYEGENKFKVGIFPVSYVEILPPEHVSSPQVHKPQEGLAKALYDFPAQTSVELQIKKGEEIHLIRKVDDNWYEGRIKDRKGIIPSSYIHVIREPGERSNSQPRTPVSGTPQSLRREKLEVSQPSSLSPSSTHSVSPRLITDSISQSPQNGFSNRIKKGSCVIEPVLYRSLYGYSPQNADELELLDGDTVYVVEMCDDGWFVGTSVRTGVYGIFPGNYVEKV